ncbi:MAG: YqgE/AlgH family protein, partial [Planctomycetaceae bacterium]|nr:YqgE/AlgH family protein [Planctomycetaceae bacterium]
MVDSLRGHFLIAGPRLRDTNFFKSVVLIFEHNDEGAMGVVINRPSSICVAHALGAHFKLPQTDDVVYVGGPVEPNALFIVHGTDELSEGETPILPGLYIGTNADVFRDVVEQSVI